MAGRDRLGDYFIHDPNKLDAHAAAVRLEVESDPGHTRVPASFALNQ
jgi:hypothetical protein